MAKVTIEQAKKTAEETSDGIFINLADDGDKVHVVFELTKNGADHLDCTEHYWNEKLGKNEEFTKQHKAEGKRANVRYTMNAFLVRQGDESGMKDINQRKLFTVNAKTFMTVLKVRDKFGLDKWVFEVERKGKKNTKSDYQFLPEALIDSVPGLREKLAASPLLEFEAPGPGSASTNGAAASNGHSNNAEDVISKEDATEIMARLKVLPRELVPKFTARFGITQIKGLKNSDLAAAKLFVSELEGKPATATNAEVDPFA